VDSRTGNLFRLPRTGGGKKHSNAFKFFPGFSAYLQEAVPFLKILSTPLPLQNARTEAWNCSIEILLITIPGFL
jgi:hypothetical protein